MSSYTKSIFLLQSPTNLIILPNKFKYRYRNSFLDKPKHLTAKLQIAVFIFHKHRYHVQAGTIVKNTEPIKIFLPIKVPTLQLPTETRISHGQSE